MVTQEAARARAQSVIERAEATLAEPSGDLGPAWEGRPVEAESAAIVRDVTIRPATSASPAFTHESARGLVKVIGGVVGEQMKASADRMTDLETRVGALEALLARASGSQQ